MKIAYLVPICLFCSTVRAQQPYNGVDSHLGNLFLLSNAQSRSISPENFNGAKGAAGKAETGTGVRCGAGTGAGLEDQPFGGYQGALDVYNCGDRWAGFDPAYLDDADGELAVGDPADLLG